ncbi:hypothetical protein Sros01_29750 [Streptomyces roseochromogenus]|nr:hypothetical protein Sros01_29750 [Streptomyces roseochromogenus]
MRNDVKSMRETFDDASRGWGPENVTRPVLLSGQCPKGAGARAELIWRDAGLGIIVLPADWRARGRAVGFQRNQELVDGAQVFREAGAQALYTAFLGLCRKPGCPKRSREQLMPDTPGHFSHGTIHRRARARAGGSRRPR